MTKSLYQEIFFVKTFVLQRDFSVQILPRKYAIKICISSASICMIEKFRNLIQILNNHEGTNYQSIVYILYFFFW